MTPRLNHRQVPMDGAATLIRLRDAQTRLAAAELQLSGDSPHEWKHAAEVAVSAGITASDAICGTRLGYRLGGDAHDDALAALRIAAGASLVKHLRALLDVKSAQSYGHGLPTLRNAAALVTHARRLVEEAQTIVGG